MSQPSTAPQVEPFLIEPYQHKPLPPKRRKSSWSLTFMLFVALAIFTSPVWAFWLLLMYSSSYGPGRGDYPAVAPDADFETRRAWGEQEMFDHFELAEKWVRQSSLIAEDVGTVTGVAPIGSPNRFYAGGFTDGAHCAMNLQVIGEKGEGLLTIPEVNVNNGYQLYGIAEESTWKFGNHAPEVIVLSGKSRLQEEGVDVLVDQIRDHAEKQEYADVVATCELLSMAMNDPEDNNEIQPHYMHSERYGKFINLPFFYRAEMLRLYADSLFQLGRDDEACSALRLESKLHLDHADLFRYRGHADHLNPGDLTRSLEAARVAIMQLSEIETDDKWLNYLATERALMSHRIRTGSFRFYYNDEKEEGRKALKRSLGELYNVVASKTQQSSWLREQLGSMKLRPKLNHCNNVRINHHGLYDATVVLEVVGSWGKSGTLQMRIRESKDGLKPLDLNAVTLREPSYPFTISHARWTDSGGEKTKLSTKTMTPYKKSRSRRH